MNAYDSLPRVLRDVCNDCRVDVHEVVQMVNDAPWVPPEFLAEQIRDYIRTLEQTNQQVIYDH